MAEGRAKIQWVNEREWRQSMVRHFEEWATGLTGNLDDLAAIAEREARARAPVRTGRLRREIEGRASGDEMVLTSGAPYGVYVEFGTRHTRAQPHMRPGLEAAIAQYTKVITQGIE